MNAQSAIPLEPAALRAVAKQVDARILTLLEFELERWSAIDADLAEPVGALHSLVAAGGKRLRPAFCYWAYVGLGGDPDDSVVVDVGAALELLHTFALVHDDVMDGSTVRRNRDAAHTHFARHHATQGWRGESRRFGDGAAILVGDFAFVYADMLMRTAPPAARPIYDELRIELCVGQYLDLVGTSSGHLDAAKAHRIETYKSAKYSIERPLHLGAALAHRFNDASDALSAFGLPLGAAFQMRDDLLGVFGDADVIGKPIGDDLREGKLTPLVAFAHQAVDHPADRALLDRIGAADLSEDDVHALREYFVRCGAQASVEQEIGGQLQSALAALAAAPLDPAAQAALADLAWFIAWRDH
jgi:geranylgeranyl diphosphate synthase type I